MKLIVGLGNPGKEYEKTRHNIGFRMIEAYAQKHNLVFNKKKFNGEFAEGIINGEKTILLKPLSYMNLSGEVVASFVHYYKINIDEIIIIHDDLDLNVGVCRLRENGSSGGHNGLKNIELHLHTQKYRRLKIGVSRPDNMDVKDYVLGHFTIEEEKQIDMLESVICKILDDSYQLTFSQLMNQYNVRVR